MCVIVFRIPLKSGNVCYIKVHTPNIFHGLSLPLFSSILHCSFHFVCLFIPSFSLTIIFFQWNVECHVDIPGLLFPSFSLSFHISWHHGSQPWTCWWEQVIIVRICDIYSVCAIAMAVILHNYITQLLLLLRQCHYVWS